MITAIPSSPVDTLKTLSEELEKTLRLINHANTQVELNVAEQYLNMFIAKWDLASKKYPNPIIVAISEKIFLKRNEWVLEDLVNADNARVKNAA